MKEPKSEKLIVYKPREAFLCTVRMCPCDQGISVNYQWETWAGGRNARKLKVEN